VPLDPSGGTSQLLPYATSDPLGLGGAEPPVGIDAERALVDQHEGLGVVRSRVHAVMVSGAADAIGFARPLLSGLWTRVLDVTMVE
jgi:hypothetical protein